MWIFFLFKLCELRAEIRLLEVSVCFCCELQSARCIMSLLIQSAEGVVRKDGGSGGGGGCKKKKSQLKLKNATKWNKDECSTEPQTEYKRQSCEIYMAGRRVEQNAKLQTLPETYITLILSPLIIQEHLRIKPAAVIHPMESFPAHLATRDRKT